jgi:hypothetical protein
VSAPVELRLPGSSRFDEGFKTILGGEPGEWLRPALPYSVIAENCAPQAIALIAVRFDLTAPKGKRMSVIHVADTLRNPEKAEFAPGSCRLFCAEAEYAAAVARRNSEISRRALLNLQNLRGMLRVKASIDCFAFDDGRFDGPDTGGAFERFSKQRAAEQALISGLLTGEIQTKDLASELNSADPARRALAAKLTNALSKAGEEAMLDCARQHRFRVPLVRMESGEHAQNR